MEGSKPREILIRVITYFAFFAYLLVFGFEKSFAEQPNAVEKELFSGIVPAPKSFGSAVGLPGGLSGCNGLGSYFKMTGVRTRRNGAPGHIKEGIQGSTRFLDEEGQPVRTSLQNFCCYCLNEHMIRSCLNGDTDFIQTKDYSYHRPLTENRVFDKNYCTPAPPSDPNLSQELVEKKFRFAIGYMIAFEYVFGSSEVRERNDQYQYNKHMFEVALELKNARMESHNLYKTHEDLVQNRITDAKKVLKTNSETALVAAESNGGLISNINEEFGRESYIYYGILGPSVAMLIKKKKDQTRFNHLRAKAFDKIAKAYERGRAILRGEVPFTSCDKQVQCLNENNGYSNLNWSSSLGPRCNTCEGTGCTCVNEYADYTKGGTAGLLIDPHFPAGVNNPRNSAALLEQMQAAIEEYIKKEDIEAITDNQSEKIAKIAVSLFEDFYFKPSRNEFDFIYPNRQQNTPSATVKDLVKAMQALTGQIQRFGAYLYWLETKEIRENQFACRKKIADERKAVMESKGDQGIKDY